jgi:hypothetical protein
MNNELAFGPLKLTQATAKKFLQSIACTFRKTEYGEYRVNLVGSTESSAYYADSLEDAVNTGVYMREFASRLHPDFVCIATGSTSGQK